MSSLLAELSRQARELPPEERAQLAEDLLESLQDQPAPDVEAAWDAEILKRIEEYERGDQRWCRPRMCLPKPAGLRGERCPFS